ncbi:MAG: hypothetical protein HY347_12905 [candidate division NC10 bacterium]|nr:hypothetical protein [candidate division NC10 bacterium]
MALFNIYENVKRAIQDLVSPEIQRLMGEIRALQVEVRRLDEKIDSRHRETLSEIHRLDERLGSELLRLDQKIDGLAEKMDLALKFHDRLARLEAKVGLSPP